MDLRSRIDSPIGVVLSPNIYRREESLVLLLIVIFGECVQVDGQDIPKYQGWRLDISACFQPSLVSQSSSTHVLVPTRCMQSFQVPDVDRNPDVVLNSDLLILTDLA